MNTVKGTAVWRGIAAGTLKTFAAAAGTAESGGVAPEQRFALAREQAIQTQRMLEERAREQAGKEAAAIFSLHAAMLEDEDFSDLVLVGIREGLDVEPAVQNAGERLAALFTGLNDSYLQERAADARDIAGEVLGALNGVRAMELEEDVILMAEDLLPSQLMGLDRSRLRGVVTRSGGVTSHTAILARGMGLPMLVGCKELNLSWEGQDALLDTWEESLFVDPEPEMRKTAERRAKAVEEDGAPGTAEPVRTAGGRQIRIQANVAGLRDLKEARRVGAEGIGLFRTEFLCLEKGRIPSEEEQYAVYRRALETMAPQPVVVRTWDLGGDKGGDWLGCGLRGVQLCLAREDLFLPQLRALLRAAVHGGLRILLPMITCVSEVQACKDLLTDCREQLMREGVPVGPVEIGAMIETPDAARCAAELAQVCDFFSIGTNDLTQYTCGLDRQQMTDDCLRPEVLRLMKLTIQAAKEKGLPVCVCGEMAGDPERTELLLGMGVDTLSVSPGRVAAVRRRAREAAKNLDK